MFMITTSLEAVFVIMSLMLLCRSSQPHPQPQWMCRSKSPFCILLCIFFFFFLIGTIQVLICYSSVVCRRPSTSVAGVTWSVTRLPIKASIVACPAFYPVAKRELQKTVNKGLLSDKETTNIVHQTSKLSARVNQSLVWMYFKKGCIEFDTVTLF